MKTLQILRHAKTERQQLNQQDFDRELTERGWRQIAELMQNKSDELCRAEDVAISSAKRTRMTFEKMASLFSGEKVRFERTLYLASKSGLLAFLEQQNDAIDNLLIIGHNDGLSDFVSYLTDDFHELPTCGYVVLELHSDSWKSVAKGIARVKEQYYPLS